MINQFFSVNVSATSEIVQIGFFVTWISLSCWWMDLSKLVYGFFCVGTWICKGCYMYLSKLLYVFLALFQIKLS